MSEKNYIYRLFGAGKEKYCDMAVLRGWEADGKTGVDPRRQ